MPHLFSYVVLGWAACAVLGGWGYFRRYQVSRPPIGVLNLTDITLMVIFILLVPLLYLVLPLWVAAGLLGLCALGVLSATWEPVLRARWAIWLVLQLMQATIEGKRHHNREQEIAEISRGLKGIAKELNVPALARGGEPRHQSAAVIGFTRKRRARS